MTAFWVRLKSRHEPTRKDSCLIGGGGTRLVYVFLLVAVGGAAAAVAVVEMTFANERRMRIDEQPERTAPPITPRNPTAQGSDPRAPGGDQVASPPPCRFC